MAESLEGCTSSIAEDEAFESCADWRTSIEAAAGVEFLVEEALLVDFDAAMSSRVVKGFGALFGASSSSRRNSVTG